MPTVLQVALRLRKGNLYSSHKKKSSDHRHAANHEQRTMSESTFTISELAREFGLTPRAIRFYEDRGLLSPKRNGQQRVYSKKDRVHLKLIVRGKRLGLSLAESKDLIALYDPGSRNKKQLQAMLDAIDTSSARLEQQLKDIQIMKDELAEARKRCLKALLENGS
ncbi:MerR family DNA-binding transcriptional regulator [Endozoicomonas sp. SESOKO1]|uniref:MerR family transcriptional regulator n=1 Tax=Endozoicomonas sp. SESOKO1 TaxID=2828742 RepID=UPI0035A04AC4